MLDNIFPAARALIIKSPRSTTPDTLPTLAQHEAPFKAAFIESVRRWDVATATTTAARAARNKLDDWRDQRETALRSTSSDLEPVTQKLTADDDAQRLRAMAAEVEGATDIEVPKPLSKVERSKLEQRKAELEAQHHVAEINRAALHRACEAAELKLTAARLDQAKAKATTRCALARWVVEIAKHATAAGGTQAHHEVALVHALMLGRGALPQGSAPLLEHVFGHFEAYGGILNGIPGRIAKSLSIDRKAALAWWQRLVDDARHEREVDPVGPPLIDAGWLEPSEGDDDDRVLGADPNDAAWPGVPATLAAYADHLEQQVTDTRLRDVVGGVSGADGGRLRGAEVRRFEPKGRVSPHGHLRLRFAADGD